MGIQIRERTIEEIEAKIALMTTSLNKIAYLESALKEGFTFDIKQQLWKILAELYEERRMFDKAGKAMMNKAVIDFTFKDKIESYLSAAELYAKAGRVDDAENMFVRAMRDASEEQKQKIRLARKNIYFVSAQDLEKRFKKASALKFYEILIKMPLDDIEKNSVKEKLIKTYHALGRFNDARLLEGV